MSEHHGCCRAQRPWCIVALWVWQMVVNHWCSTPHAGVHRHARGALGGAGGGGCGRLARARGSRPAVPGRARPGLAGVHACWCVCVRVRACVPWRLCVCVHVAAGLLSQVRRVLCARVRMHSCGNVSCACTLAYRRRRCMVCLTLPMRACATAGGAAGATWHRPGCHQP